MRLISLTAALFITLFAIGACDSSSSEASTEEAIAEETAAEETPAEAKATDDTHGEDHKDAELATDLKPGETRHFGAPFTIDGEPVALGDLLANIGDDEDFASGETVKVRAQVHRVCQAKGCWFTLATDAVDVPVRVRMKDYGFFVSRNSDGAEAIVEGTFARTTISEELAQHYADDVAAAAGDTPEQVVGEQDTFEFTATGITMTLAES